MSERVNSQTGGSDVLSSKQRSYCMSRIRGRDTKAELSLRKAAFALGLRYRLRSKLPGRPDLIFPSARLAVFVDGCFWHRCPQHATYPRANAEFWDAKIGRNVERDRQVDKILKAAGWAVLRVWEHEVDDAPAAVAERVRKKVLQRKAQVRESARKAARRRASS
jgi:DNA mismatch endonuclease, patch repair protein